MLRDRFGRNIDYLRLSLTGRCDLHCTYCIPKGLKEFEEPRDWLTFDEIERLVGAFARLGTQRVRLTGAEPLLRRNLVGLTARLSRLPGITDLSLSTNATRLGRFAAELRAAGIASINVSRDSLDRACMEKITGRDSLGRILDGIMAGKQAGFAPIKINMVALRGVNDHQIDDMVAFCIEHHFVLRLIEAMPMGATRPEANWLDLGPVERRLREKFARMPRVARLGGGPARYLVTPDGRTSVGFITPLLQHFCGDCNRVRPGVDGTLYLCLGQQENFDFRPLLRANASDSELEAAIRLAIELKPEKHEFRVQPGKIMRFMAHTGG